MYLCRRVILVYQTTLIMYEINVSRKSCTVYLHYIVHIIIHDIHTLLISLTFKK